MKAAVCIIVKNENLYLRDWVEHYKSLQFDNILLYDNNSPGGEYPQYVIGDYLSSGYVLYHDVRGQKRFQKRCYNMCYEKYRDKFDWIAFFDCDEYLFLNKDKDIHSYLGRFSNLDISAIQINWRVYGDNNKLFYENIPLPQRFPLPVEPIHFKCKYHGDYYPNSITKTIVRGKLPPRAIVDFSSSVHVPDIVNAPQECPYCDNKGMVLTGKKVYYLLIMNYELAELRHYYTLTVSEFLHRRFLRRDYAAEFNIDQIGLFEINEMTPEKTHIIEEFFKMHSENPLVKKYLEYREGKIKDKNMLEAIE